VLAKKERVLIEGVRLIKKHVRKSQDQPSGGIVEREGPIHISNVKLIERPTAAKESKPKKTRTRESKPKESKTSKSRTRKTKTKETKTKKTRSTATKRTKKKK
jgi:ribosomal protein L24